MTCKEPLWPAANDTACGCSVSAVSKATGCGADSCVEPSSAEAETATAVPSKWPLRGGQLPRGAAGDGVGVRVVDLRGRERGVERLRAAARRREGAVQDEPRGGARRIGEAGADEIEPRRRQHQRRMQLVDARRGQAVVEPRQLRRGAADHCKRERDGGDAHQFEFARLMTNE